LRNCRRYYETALDEPGLFPEHAATRVWLSMVNAEIAARLGRA